MYLFTTISLQNKMIYINSNGMTFLRTERPRGGITLAIVSTISRIELNTTKKSNLLKRGMK